MESASVDNITKSFLHSGISNSLDGSANHICHTIPTKVGKDDSDDEHPFDDYDEVDQLRTLNSNDKYVAEDIE